MEIENSSLYNEIQLITNSGSRPIAFYWTAMIHVGDENIEILKVVTVDTLRDYEKNIGDETNLELLIPLGKYAKRIYPNRNNMEITLYRKPLGEASDQVQDSRDIDSERFKAVLVLDGLPVIEGTELGQQSEGALDLMDIIKVNFQIFNKSLEKLRVVTVGGVFRNTTGFDVVQGIMAKESQRLKIDGEVAIDGVDMIEPNNKNKRAHVIIPQGTKLLSVPTYVQERAGGIYSAAIGSYFQNGFWYVYPLFDTTRLIRSERTVTLIKVPKNRYTGVERTYREEGGSLFIMGTSESKFTDSAGTDAMNSGNGVRIADANKFMGETAKVSGNKAVMSRGRNNAEFVSENSDDGKNNVQVSDDPISSNFFVEYSRLASRQGGLYSFIWENSNPSLLFPGMCARILFLDGENIVELHGVLLASQVLVQLAGQGLQSDKHLQTTKLHLFVNKPKEV